VKQLSATPLKSLVEGKLPLFSEKVVIHTPYTQKKILSRKFKKFSLLGDLCYMQKKMYIYIAKNEKELLNEKRLDNGVHVLMEKKEIFGTLQLISSRVLC
jgi:hypothetical protein